ncbi:MAG: NINE protein [Clostridia bacterium]|nr:NINE protein [Clostridia bacterium]
MIKGKAKESDDKKVCEQKSTTGTDVVANKKKMNAILFSIFFGVLGVDRFYMGYVGLGVIKLLTFGGLGIWALIDMILICAGSLRPADGSPWADEVVTVQNAAYSQPQSKQDNNLNAIEKLAKLHDQGILTDEEYQQKKADLLSKM